MNNQQDRQWGTQLEINTVAEKKTSEIKKWDKYLTELYFIYHNLLSYLNVYIKTLK